MHKWGYLLSAVSIAGLAAVPSAQAADKPVFGLVMSFSGWFQPIDADTIRAAARDTGAIITIEDHWPEGGIGDAVLEALAGEQSDAVVEKLAVREMPGSGTPAELLHAAGIDADCIADAARRLIDRTSDTTRSTVGSATPA